MIQEFSSTRTSHSLCRATTAFFPQRLLIWMPKLNNVQSRARALLIAATERISCEVYDSTDKKVAAGVAGDNSQELPGGDYRVVVKAGTNASSRSVSQSRPGKMQNSQSQ